MDIYRQGAERNRGRTYLVEELSFKTDEERAWKNNVQWDEYSKRLEIRPKWIRHTDDVTHHNYTILLTLDDISSLIGLLGHAGAESDAKLLREHLSKHVPAIVKLLACATGIVPTPMEDIDAVGE